MLFSWISHSFHFQHSSTECFSYDFVDEGVVIICGESFCPNRIIYHRSISHFLQLIILIKLFHLKSMFLHQLLFLSWVVAVLDGTPPVLVETAMYSDPSAQSSFLPAKHYITESEASFSIDTHRSQHFACISFSSYWTTNNHPFCFTIWSQFQLYL